MFYINIRRYMFEDGDLLMVSRLSKILMSSNRHIQHIPLMVHFVLCSLDLLVKYKNAAFFGVNYDLIYLLLDAVELKHIIPYPEKHIHSLLFEKGLLFIHVEFNNPCFSLMKTSQLCECIIILLYL